MRRISALVAALALVGAGCATVQRVSLGAGGSEPHGPSVSPALSADGRVVAFASAAPDLVTGDTNGVADVFVRSDDTVTRVSVATGGAQANGPSSHPSVSGDGRYVAFQSDATNLVPGDGNGVTDVFVHDRVAHTTTLVSVPAAASTTAPAAGSPAGPTAAVEPVAPLPAPAPLAARAAAAPVRVIVRTTPSFRPEGALRAAGVAAQRADLAADRARVRDLVGGDGRVLAELDRLPVVVAEVGAAALARLDADPGVVGITPDDPVPAALESSGPVVGLPATHDAGITGQGEAVAILDTGVERTHPFLGGRVVHEACYSLSGNCPNGTTTQVGTGSGAPCTYAPVSCRHGTHVAGIAAGRRLDADGVAPGADIVSIQVFSRIDSPALCTRGENPCPLTFPSDWILALDHLYEIRDQIPVVAANMSIGGITTTTACDQDSVKPAIDQLASVGIATVIAAGNEGQADAVGYPACISTAIAVGASDDADQPASFSNSSALVDLFAPGVGVVSSVPGGGYASFNGTSMATPHVTGAIALAREADPGLTVAGVTQRLRATGTTIHDARNGLDFPRLCTSALVGFDRCPNPGGSRRPSISLDGARIAFESDRPLVASDANGTTDVYLRDRGAGSTTLVSRTTSGAAASGRSQRPSISGDGTGVGFESTAPDLVVDDTNGRSDVFLRAVPTGETYRLSLKGDFSQSPGASREVSLGPNPTSWAFTSDAALLPEDTNGVADVYAFDLTSFTLQLVSRTATAIADGPSGHPSLVDGGRVVVFLSDATNLGADPNHHRDAFVRVRDSSLLQRLSTRLLLDGTDRPATGVAAAATGGVVAFTTATGELAAPDRNDTFDVFRRVLLTPERIGATIAPVAPGATTSFVLTGAGLRAPVALSAPDATFTIATQSPTTVTGTVSISPGAPTGPRAITVSNLTAVPGLVGLTVCGACLTVAP